MKTIVSVRRLSFRSLLKLMFLGNAVCFLLLFVLGGALSILGYQVVQLNGQYVTGLTGIGTSTAMSAIAIPMMGFGCGFLMWIPVAFGLWIYSFFRPIKLRLIDPQEIQTEQER